MKTNSCFPMFVDISKKNVLVVGGGAVAARRVKALLAFVGNIKVVAPRIDERLQGLGIELVERKFHIEDLQDKDMVIIASDDKPLNEEIARLCQERGILKNVATAPQLCDFYFPGMIIKEDYVIGISSRGKSPKKSRKLREKLEVYLENEK